jgi:hypothetical protein
MADTARRAGRSFGSDRNGGASGAWSFLRLEPAAVAQEIVVVRDRLARHAARVVILGRADFGIELTLAAPERDILMVSSLLDLYPDLPQMFIDARPMLWRSK